MCLPINYSIRVSPLPKLCDDCYKKLDDNSGGIELICDYDFYWHCYDRIEYGCQYCEQYYKNEINKNVNLFLQSLKKEANMFFENNRFEKKSQNLEEDTEEHKTIQEKNINLQNALEDIDKW